MASTVVRDVEDDSTPPGAEPGSEDQQREDEAGESDIRAQQTLSFDGYGVAVGTAGNDVIDIDADDRVESVWGRDGSDRITGGAGENNLHGDAGADTLTGGDAMDQLEGGDGMDWLVGRGGEDMLMGGAGNDVLDAGAGHEGLDGGQGDDILIGGAGPDAFTVRPDSGHDVIEDFEAGLGMFDHLALEAIRADELRFRDGPDGVTISWNDGQSSVLLRGVAFRDLAQDDFMFNEGRQLVRPILDTGDAEVGSSAANEDPGAPARGMTLSDERSAGLGDDFASADGQVRALGFDRTTVTIGTAGADTIDGGDEHDAIWGLSGDDRLDGGAGDNTLYGDAGDDVLAAGDGVDHIEGGDGDDAIDGGDGDNVLGGGGGDDRIRSGASHDMIDGSAGDDILIGGAGADAFMIRPDSGHDVVEDFDAGPDAFDHLAVDGFRAEDLTLEEDEDGVTVSWNDGQGSVLLRGVSLSDLAQDDFMFVEGPDFVPGLTPTSMLSDELFLS